MSLYDWSLTAADNATADPLINWQEGQNPSTVNNSARAMMVEIAKWLDDIGAVLTSTGTAPAYSLAPTATIAGYADGQVFGFRAHAANSGAATLNISGLGAKALVAATGAALAPNAIRTGQTVLAAYHAASTSFRVLNIGQADMRAHVAGQYVTTVGGTGNAITLTTGDTLLAYQNGHTFAFRAAAGNTAAVTLNVDGLGAKPVTKFGGQPLAQGDIVANQIVWVTYDTTLQTFQAGSPMAQTASGIGAGVGDVIVTADTTPKTGRIRLTETAQAVLKATWPELNSWASALGYPWGSDATTFNLPPAAGYFLRFAATNASVDTGGARTAGSIQQDQTRLTSHVHVQQGVFTTTSAGLHDHVQTNDGYDADYGAQIGTHTSGSIAANGNEVASAARTQAAGLHSHAVTISGNTQTAGDSLETRARNVAFHADIIASVAAANAAAVGLYGFNYAFNAITTGANPGAGFLAFNNASPSSATSVTVSETDGYGQSVAATLAALLNGASSPKAVLHVNKVGNPAVFANFSVTGFTDSGAFDTLAVTHLNSSGTLAQGDPLAVTAFPTGSPGAQGPLGIQGPTGPSPGLDYQWNTGTTGDPGSGKLLANNAVVANATQIHISETNRVGAGQAAFIATWDDSTNTAHRGLLRIVDVALPGVNFVELAITGAIVDAGGYDTIPVTHINSAGTLTSDMLVSVVFARTGDKGANGAGAGDVVGPSSAVDNQIVLYDGTTGKLVKASSLTGILKATAGVPSAADAAAVIAALGYEPLKVVEGVITTVVPAPAGAQTLVDLSPHIANLAGAPTTAAGAFALFDIFYPGSADSGKLRSFALWSPAGSSDLWVSGYDTAGAVTGWKKLATTSYVDSLLADFPTRTAAAAATIDGATTTIRTRAYATAGDGGGAIYRRAGAGPVGPTMFQSVDGAWWTLETVDANAKQFGARGDNSTNDTASLSAFFAAGGGWLPPGIYLSDDIDVTVMTRVECHPDAVIRKRAGGSTASRLIEFRPGAEGSVWRGGVIDGNRATLKAGWSQAATAFDGWFGMMVDCARVSIDGVKFVNWVDRPFWFAGDDLVARSLRIEDCGGGAIFGYRYFGAGAYTTRPVGNGATGQTVNGLVSLRADNDGVAAVFQHVVDFWACSGGHYSDMEARDQDGDTAGSSAYASGFTMESCIDCHFGNIKYVNPTTNTLVHLGISLVGCVRCEIAGPVVANIAGTALEHNGCINCQIANPVLDGFYRTTTAVPAGSSSHLGVSDVIGEWDNDRTSKSLSPSQGLVITGGLVTRFYNGLSLRGSSTTMSGTAVVGNDQWGVSITELTTGEFITGAPEVDSARHVFDGCVITHNGREGINGIECGALVVSGGVIADNGQDATGSADQRVGVSISESDSATITGAFIGDTQGWTATDAVSYQPQASVSSRVTVHTNRQGLLQVGQRIKLIGALAGPADLTVKVMAINADDTVVLVGAGSFSLVSTGNLTAMSGTWSGSGTALTGTGGAASTQITGQTWVTNGTEYRRVTKALTDNSILVNDPFTTPLSGATLQMLTVDMQAIRSQQQGIRAFGSASKLMLAANNFDGNVQHRTQLTTPANAAPSCQFYRRATITTNAAAVNFLTSISRDHQLIGVSAKVDTTLSGGGITSWTLALKNSGGSTITTIATGLALTAGTLVRASVDAGILTADANVLQFNSVGGTPTAGAITLEALFEAVAPPSL